MRHLVLPVTNSEKKQRYGLNNAACARGCENNEPSGRGLSGLNVRALV